MILPEKICALRDGGACALRSPGPDDAPQLLDYLRQTSAQTDYMARYADEITMSVKKERDFIAALQKDPRGVMLAAFVGGRPVGNCSVIGFGARRKLAHRAALGIAVLRDCWHRGVGGLLLENILTAAGAAGYETVELSVVRENTRALALYERFGFETFAVQPRAFKLDDGRYYDLCLMAKSL